MRIELFGKTAAGEKVTKYTLKNDNGMEVSIIDLGATVTSIKLQDKNGKVRDVALGYDTVENYEKYTCYFGAIIGRNANRISNAACQIDGVEYKLDSNHFENNLHSGNNGLNYKVWNAEFDEKESNKIVFSILSPDMEQQFPGNMQVKVTYELTDDNGIVIDYQATTDKTTLANFTNHTYFNLNGHESGNVETQELVIHGSHYNPMIDEKAIPVGTCDEVEGTPLDFRQMKVIGDNINDSFEQTVYAKGYDHNFILDSKEKSVRLAAKAQSQESGIVLEIYTDAPCVQFYSGNFIGEQDGKDGADYHDRQGFCLEPQYCPNAINVEAFESPLLHPGEEYHSQERIQFSLMK